MVSRLWRRILSLHFCQEFVYLRAKTSKKPNQILRSTRAAFRALQRRSWTLLDLGSMYSEQDPCGCCVEQADIDPGEIQVVEAASINWLQLNLSTLKVYHMTRRTKQVPQGFLLEFHRSNGNGTVSRCLESLDVLQDFASVRCTTFEACERHSGMAPELGL